MASLRAPLRRACFDIPLSSWWPQCTVMTSRRPVPNATWTGTRSRSRRPNHMRSQIGSPKAMRPVDLRRLAGGLHSVAKQAFFNIAFCRAPGRFWSDFGRLSEEAKMEPRIDFLDAFLRCFFRMRFGIDFGSFSGGPNPEKSIKTIVLQCFLLILIKSTF